MGVNDASLSASALGEASSGLAEVAAEFVDEFGGAPTLAEFLDIIGSALPANSAATDGMTWTTISSRTRGTITVCWSSECAPPAALQ